jgi:hypothetical protein
MSGSGGDSLLFATHAPGAIVGPRSPDVMERDEDMKRIVENLKKDEEKKKNQEEDERRAEEEAQRKEEERAQRAREREEARARRERGDPEPAKRPSPVAALAENAGTGAAARARTREAASHAISSKQTSSRARVALPAFLTTLPGALARPFHPSSYLPLLGGVLMLATALLLLELSPLVGVIACTVAAVELLALRVRYIRDSAEGVDALHWPEWSELFAAISIYPCVLALLFPAALLGALAVGSTAWSSDDPSSIPGRCERAWDTVRENPTQAGSLPGQQLLASEALLPQETMGRTSLRVMQALIGDPAEDVAGTNPQELATSLSDVSKQRARQVFLLEGAGGLGIVARGLALAGLLLLPMSLLAAAKLKSAYAALHLPMVVRSIARTLPEYLVVVGALVVQTGALLASLLLLPALLVGTLSPFPAHLVTVAVFSLLGVSLPVITGGVMGRFYRVRNRQLGWE